MGGKLLNDIKSMYVNNLACFRVKVSESACFKINRRMREGCMMSPWLFNVYMDEVNEVKMGWGGGE